MAQLAGPDGTPLVEVDGLLVAVVLVDGFDVDGGAVDAGAVETGSDGVGVSVGVWVATGVGVADPFTYTGASNVSLGCPSVATFM